MTTTTAALPDVNVRTSPYEVVQHLLDQAATFVLFAVPDRGYTAQQATLTPGHPDDYFGINGGYGMDVRSLLHRFEADARTSPSFAVAQTVGEPVGVLGGRFLIGPDDFEWRPGKLPPATMFDPWRSQAFALVDAEITVARGDGFRGYAVGRTFPVVVEGRPGVLAGAVGNVTEGFGRLAGLEGTFALNGAFVDLGFRGQVSCRIVDPDGRLRTERELPPPTAVADPDSGATYIVMRGEKAHAGVRTEYGPPPDPHRVSLVTPAQMRAVRYRQRNGDSTGPRVATTLGPVVAELEATVRLDILAPPGTAERPNAFETTNVYAFADGTGSIRADVVVGRSFGLAFRGHPEQGAMRYGGLGPIVEGTGAFQGVRGLLTVNSAIGIAPHALSMLNVLQIVDPGQRFRAGQGGRR